MSGLARRAVPIHLAVATGGGVQRGVEGAGESNRGLGSLNGEARNELGVDAVIAL
eukprot:CAMPEP_0119071758 /NCGR_PEP_ID=MMETSP1178-20130426/54037_1 /TAXON_ID=33656 /ORGANISM="unid sp, Strain CCMP2000" /LENGTH=54 /DNA_ID=CAMNT_0007053719 /DNA_START=49 /DNA_END=209 /DNA_ORIENTATION=-